VKDDLSVEPAGDQTTRFDRSAASRIEAESEDVCLLAAIAEGDQQALATLYRHHGALIYSLIVRILVNEMEAQEVMQDTFLQIWRRAIKYNPQRSSAIAWMIMIARGLALDRLRARSRRSTGHAAYEREVASLEVEINRTQQTERDELAAACASALNNLPESQGRTLQLAFLRGWTHEEIASAIGEPLGTVKTRIRRGLLALRKVLKDYHA
jgi:RNA polymerase sigma-70 factor (ECF subfamily)